MQIQVNTDNHIEGNADLVRQVHAHLEDKLQRFSSRITRLEVHFTDESSASKEFGDDKRCLLEARLNGMQPVSVTDRGPALLQTLHGATRKMVSLLDTTLGKLDSRR